MTLNEVKAIAVGMVGKDPAFPVNVAEQDKNHEDLEAYGIVPLSVSMEQDVISLPDENGGMQPTPSGKCRYSRKFQVGNALTSLVKNILLDELDQMGCSTVQRVDQGVRTWTVKWREK